MAQATERSLKGMVREKAVIRAAARAIAELGLANVRVTDIAERAGIGVGHVTYYFPSKSALLMQALQWSEDEMHDEIAREIGRIQDPWKRLRRLIELAASSGPGDPGWVLWFEVWAKAGTDHTIARDSEELFTWWRGAFGEVIRYGSERGAFAADDMEEVVLALSALIDGLSIEVTIGAAGMTRRRLMDVCMSAAHRYLDPPRPSRTRGQAGGSGSV